MKTRQWLYGIAVILVTACCSCNKNKLEQAKYIPKDANIVLGIQPQALSDKLKDHQDLMDSLTQFFTGIVADLSDTNKQSAAVFLKSIDTKQPIFIFIQAKNSIAEGNTSLKGMVLPLSDANKFADYAKTNLVNTVSQGKGYSFGMLKNSYNGTMLGWNKNSAIFIVYDGDDTSAVPAQLETLFNLKESESLADNHSFTSSYDAKADISFYFNSTQSALASSLLAAAAMTKASDLIKDTYSAGSINFNNGSIDISMKNYPNAVLQNMISKNPSKALDGKALNNYPGKLQGMIDFSINPKLLVSIIQYMGLDQMIAPFLQKQGLTLDDIAAVFKGEFAAGISNFFAFSNGNAPQYLICLPFADKAAYDKLINALAKNNPDMFVNKNGQFIPLIFTQNPNSLAYSADANNLVIASSQGMIDSFSTGKSTTTLPDDANKNLKGKTAYLYGDLQSISSGIPANNGIDSGTATIIKRTFKDFSLWGNAPAGKVYGGEAHLRFMDEKQNSLVSLLTMIKDLKALRKQYYDSLINANSQDDTLPPADSTLPAD